MKKNILIAALMVTTAAVAMRSSPASAADDAIKQVFAALDRCLTNNDAKCVGELLVEDATFAAPTGGAKIIKGNAQIVKTLGDLMGGPAPDKGGKQTHTVENVRMIGEDHAVVDSSVEVPGSEAGRNAYHAVTVMVRKGDKWLFEDLRSYVVEPPAPAKKDAAPSGKKEPAPPANS